ncbi:type IV secretory system conjugative DNA transfer family protein [Lolliginicoccus levis]|uniref:type IV secretory system conjugative DNA transfer family protein n=1 Tax=Lolliginicoccus levis TaxID=2919542 RepID=UPI00241E408B|nr:TraM recognition domain-containing protein [Lolliginicoccus levis]
MDREAAKPLGMVAAIGVAYGGLQAWLAIRDGADPLAMVALIAGVVGLVALLGAGGWWMWRSRHRDDSPGARELDKAARHLARHSQLTGITESQARRSSARLRRAEGAPGDSPDGWGMPLGELVGDGRMLRASWESSVMIIAGTRTGKSTSYAIPLVVGAPGAVIATSNKPDVYAGTWRVRRDGGHREWLFDPQSIAGTAKPGFRLDPLVVVRDPETAMELAGHFVAAAKTDNAVGSSYFDGASHKALGSYILAAALAGGDMLHVAEWLNRPTLDLPARVLAAHGFAALAQSVAEMNNLNDRQQQGVYGMAQQFMEVMSSPGYAAWVCPATRAVISSSPAGGGTDRGGYFATDADDDREVFDPAAFVASTDTLYAISRDNDGSPKALVTALVGMVMRAGGEQAATMPGGRLGEPVVAVLDEAANICKLRELPGMLSYAGGIGICLVPIIQSRQQGERVWGRGGFGEMWGVANAKVYLGGNHDADFAAELSRLVGEHERTRENKSYGGKGGKSWSQSVTREPILPADRLAAMPLGRGLLLSSGNRPALIKTRPWFRGEHAEAIRASQDAFTSTEQDLPATGEPVAAATAATRKEQQP